MLSDDDLYYLLKGGKPLTLLDIKEVMLSIRHSESKIENIAYANTLFPEAGDYLSPFLLSALIREETSNNEVALNVEQNKRFFTRLIDLLPSIVGYFNAPKHGVRGLLFFIDDCHHDYHISAKSFRKDRALREADESIQAALHAVKDAEEALSRIKGHIDYEYEAYHSLYFPKADNARRNMTDLIRELKLCTGVLEIIEASHSTNPHYLLLPRSDKRTVLVHYAHMMSQTWDGPKLVTTPGSDFSNLCSLLLEAVAGKTNESLAGAINRYARSDKRKQEESYGEEDLYENDNFSSQLQTMSFSKRSIEECKRLLGRSDLSNIARTLLLMKLGQVKGEFDTAQNAYGPHQIWINDLNETQLKRFTSLDFDFRKVAEIDRAIGDLRRAVKGRGIDV